MSVTTVARSRYDQINPVRILVAILLEKITKMKLKKLIYKK